MSSMTRSIQRNMVRQMCLNRDGNTKAFHKEWEKVHYPREEITDTNGNVISKVKNTQKRKHTHVDNGKVFIKQLKAFKQFVSSLAKAKKTDAEAVAKVSTN